MPYRCPMCGSGSTEKEVMFGQTTSDRLCRDCGFADLASNFQVEQGEPLRNLEGLSSVVSRVEPDNDGLPMILFLDGDRWKVPSEQLHTMLDAMRKAIEMNSLYGGEAATENQYLTPTQLGDRAGIKARQMNTLLESAGLQFKITDSKGKSKWDLSEEGKKYGSVQLVNSSNTDWSGGQVKWLPTVLDVLGLNQQSA